MKNLIPTIPTIVLTANEIVTMTDFLPRYVNRETKRSHINAIKKSVLKIGVVRDLVVVRMLFLNPDIYYIVDGQHLREALIELGVGACVKVITINSEDDLIEKISMLNSTAKNWGLGDYLKAWVTAGKADYIYLDKLLIELGHKSLTGLMEAYCSRCSKTFKTGQLKIQKEIGDEIIEVYKSLLSLGLKNSVSSLVAFTRFYKEGNNSVRLLERAISRNVNVYSQTLTREEFYTYLTVHYSKK